MPNWVYNTVQIQGTPTEIEAIKNQLNSPFTMEQTDPLKDEERTVTFSNPVFAFWNIVRPPVEKMDEYNTTHGWSKEGQTGDTEYNWYNFNHREWGTKWDVAVSDDAKYRETELVGQSPVMLTYRFNTAWSDPREALKALSAQYPKARILNEWEEEQGYGATTYYKNGTVSEKGYYDFICDDCGKGKKGEYIYDEDSATKQCKPCSKKAVSA